MGATDVILAVLILGAAAYLLYRSVWKKKGYCPGCTSGTCEEKGAKRPPASPIPGSSGRQGKSGR